METRKFLKKMLRLVNIGDEVMVTFDIVTDASYIWEIIPEFLPQMQESIKQYDITLCEVVSVSSNTMIIAETLEAY